MSTPAAQREAERPRNDEGHGDGSGVHHQHVLEPEGRQLGGRQKFVDTAQLIPSEAMISSRSDRYVGREHTESIKPTHSRGKCGDLRVTFKSRR
jgi:hypothetical protein